MKKTILYIVAIILAVCFCSYVGKNITSFQQNKNISTYENEEYHISFHYDKDWKPNPLYENRYEGRNGFFQINASSGENLTIDEIANYEARHQLEPYGTNPKITKLTIQGQEARVIRPSSDQAKEYKQQAALIIKYPKDISINGETYSYFILYADMNHIENIAQTIQFLTL